jgi:DNA replication protein DnaC
MNDVEKALKESIAKLDAMIESAPSYEDDFPVDEPLPSIEPPAQRCNHPLIDFPDRHSRDIELVGTEWHAAFAKAIQIAQDGGIIIAWGKRGTGKTQIAYMVAKRGIFHDPYYPIAKKDGFTMPQHARPCIYTKAMDIFIDLKNGFGRPNEPSEKQILTKLIDAAFLVIDEAHVRGETKYEDDKLTHLIDKRYDAMRPTMLITNLTNKDFAAQLSPSILSRIAEIGGGIECNWQSYRKQTK